MPYVFKKYTLEGNSKIDLSLYVLKTDMDSRIEALSYEDLKDKPSIPTKTSELDNDSNFITNIEWKSF